MPAKSKPGTLFHSGVVEVLEQGNHLVLSINLNHAVKLCHISIHVMYSETSLQRQLWDDNFGPWREFACFWRLLANHFGSLRLVVLESQVGLQKPFVERFLLCGVKPKLPNEHVPRN